MWLRSFVFAGAVISMVSVSASGGAQPAGSETSILAESLFREGRALLEAGNEGSACPKLEESKRLELAGGTVLALALCYEQSGRVASAWVEYQLALALAQRAGRSDRTKGIQERIAALEARLHWVEVKVSAEQRALAGFAMTKQGVQVPSASWGTPVALDPGEYSFEASAPGYARWTETVVVPTAPGRTIVSVPTLSKDVAQVPLAPATTSEPAPSRPAPVPPAAKRSAAPPPTQPERPPPRAVAYVLLGGGAVALGAAGYFSLESIAARSRARGGCSTGVCAQAVEGDFDSAVRWDRAAVIAAGVGALAAGSGGYLVLGHSDQPRHRSSTRAALGYSLLGVGAGAAIAGGILEVRNLQNANEAWGECQAGTCGAEQRATIDEAPVRQTVARLVWGAGLLTASAGVVLLLTGEQSARSVSLATTGSRILLEGEF